jgi:hypothetical protein
MSKISRFETKTGIVYGTYVPLELIGSAVYGAASSQGCKSTRHVAKRVANITAE